jgi:hypothetical protein
MLCTLPSPSRVSTIVLRPGPVQGSGFGFWLGHLVWPGRPGQFFLKKSKQRHFSKKKSQRVCNRVLTGSTCRVSRVTLGFSFLCFFFNPPPFRPRTAKSRVDLSSRVKFQNYDPHFLFSFLFYPSNTTTSSVLHYVNLSLSLKSNTKRNLSFRSSFQAWLC